MPTTTFTNQFGNTTTTHDANGATNPYAPSSGPQSIALQGPPVANLPNIETATNVTATALAVYESGGRPTVVVTEQLVQWQGASLVAITPTIVAQSPGGTPGFNYSTIETNFNEVNGITSTEQFLQNKMGVANPQQGANVTNAPVSYTGGIASSAVQTFRWE